MIETFRAYFKEVPAALDTQELLRYALALNHKYQPGDHGIPLPIWRREGFPDDGMKAWQVLCALNESLPDDRGLNIYVHVPFCPSRCSFCDCLTMQLKQHTDRVLDEYTDCLLAEIHSWQDCGTVVNRPISTVHFGGGTPLFLGQERLLRLVDAIRGAFHILPETEWALETSSSSLTPSMFSFLHDAGFRRLHLGVQSMEDRVRPLLKRRETAVQVLEKIRTAGALDWIISVDLMVGLPEETLQGTLKGIEDLIAAGTDGFSVYEIILTNQNKHFTRQYHLRERDPRLNYFLFLAVVETLNRAGFQKNLFNHFANARDKNIYFTFPERGEDCLAMGAYADGVFGDYHYRHPGYLQYRMGTLDKQPVLQGGIEKPPSAKHLFPLEIAILSGGFTAEQCTRILPEPVVHSLLRAWEAALLIHETQPGHYLLTPNGAWFSGNMVRDLTAAGSEV